MTKVRNTKIGSVYPFLDARTPMADSPLLPVKLSVILKGSQFRVGLKLYATNDVFNKAMTGKGTIPKEAKLLKDRIDVYLQKAKDILDQFPNADKKMFSNLLELIVLIFYCQAITVYRSPRDNLIPIFIFGIK
jgi:hypothetical protein